MTALGEALAAGFGSYAQFYRVCRELTGRGPGAIRASPPDDDRDVSSVAR
jgi:hypothetical protein